MEEQNDPVEKLAKKAPPSKNRQRNDFILKNFIRGFLWLAAIIAIFLIFKKYIGTYYLEWLLPLTGRPILIYLVFMVSETFVGIFPPEFFMMWALDFGLTGYVENILLFALLSYIGGIIAFGLGKWLKNTIYVKRMLRSKKSKRYMSYYQDYGGILIILAAITPIPFALISTISGSLGFRFLTYLQFASARFLRFAVYGWIIWEINTF